MIKSVCLLSHFEYLLCCWPIPFKKCFLMCDFIHHFIIVSFRISFFFFINSPVHDLSSKNIFLSHFVNSVNFLLVHILLRCACIGMCVCLSVCFFSRWHGLFILIFPLIIKTLKDISILLYTSWNKYRKFLYILLSL